MSDHWEVEIHRDGMWPLRWTWRVWREGAHIDLRFGDALTKERARRAAVKARLSMERDDLRLDVT